jgi:phage tail tape-measure protein
MKTAKWLRVGVSVLSLAGLVGCESADGHKGAIIGGVGAGILGAAAGAAIGGGDHRAGGAVIGGAIGAAGGAVAGDQLYDKKKREEAEAAKKAASQAPAAVPAP